MYKNSRLEFSTRKMCLNGIAETLKGLKRRKSLAPSWWKWGGGLYILSIWLFVQVLAFLGFYFHFVTLTTFYVEVVVTSVLVLFFYYLEERVRKGRSVDPTTHDSFMLFMRLVFTLALGGLFWFGLAGLTVLLRTVGVITATSLPLLYEPSTTFITEFVSGLAIGGMLANVLWPKVKDKGYYSRAFK